MPELDYKEINNEVLDALDAPPVIYYLALMLLGSGILIFFLTWLFQMKTGMGVTGLNNPTGWGVYIANFVFWVGIAHSGTLISAILYLVRAKYRDAVSRSAEAMTIFAIAVAGMFPLVHLGRFWVFYYILPYPSERQIWPNFISPLVWDVMAVFTYFTVSVIFFYVGLIPDLAAAREHFRKTKGENHPRTKLYSILSLGWYGAATQWVHYGRAYLFFAALATPLVISVHSVVSWDFAMALLPGWHTTLFAPYFVAGAIHSGLAMVLVLLIPMRKLLKLERLMKIDHFEKVAQTILVTASILGYSYMVLPFMVWYSGDIFDKQFEIWRATQTWAWAYWGIILLNVILPSTLAFKKLRCNFKWLFFIGIIVVSGMWIERFFLVPSSEMHDFLPHNWGPYVPRLAEIAITAGSFCLFFFLFVTFSKSFPTVPLSDVKSELAIEQTPFCRVSYHSQSIDAPASDKSVIRAHFNNSDTLLKAVNQLIDNKISIIEAYSPQRMAPLMQSLGLLKSPVRWWTFAFGLIGAASGYGLALFSALRNHLIVGGKHPVSLVPYTIIGFEFTILFASIANLIALILYCGLFTKKKKPIGYSPEFASTDYGIIIQCTRENIDPVFGLLRSSGAEHCELISTEDLKKL